MDETFKMQIGLAVRDARRAMGLTQEDLAEKIGRTPEAISNIERGKALPTLVTLRDMAQALEVSLQRLVPDTQPDTPKSLRRLGLDQQLRSLVERFDDRTLEAAIRQIEALADLHGKSR